ncbi:hypothetical protein C8T65DRAFT_662035 [Cerioporus squamosus]|nr:hypothetical protein C8T65DRAFT_662035 [Cerioporus squamosus]
MPSSTAHDPEPPLQVSKSRVARQSIDFSENIDPSGKQSVVVSLENFTGQIVPELNEDGMTLQMRLPLPKTHDEYEASPHPQRRQFKIRNTDRHVIWYYTEAQRRLEGPPAHLLSPNNQSLYVHKYRDDTQVWMARIYPGWEHPDLEGYELHLIEKGPRWVKNASARGYENVQRKRAQVAREK